MFAWRVRLKISKSFRKKRTNDLLGDNSSGKGNPSRKIGVQKKKKNEENNREQWCCSFRSSIEESSSVKFRIESIELAALYS